MSLSTHLCRAKVHWRCSSGGIPTSIGTELPSSCPARIIEAWRWECVFSLQEHDENVLGGGEGRINLFTLSMPQPSSIPVPKHIFEMFLSLVLFGQSKIISVLGV